MGWYSTGPRLKEADLDIQALLGGYVEHPVLVICEVEVRGLSGARRACVVCGVCVCVCVWLMWEGRAAAGEARMGEGVA